MRSVFGGKLRLLKAAALVGAAVGVARQLRQRVVDQSPFNQPTTGTQPPTTGTTDISPPTLPSGVEGTLGSATQSGEVSWVAPIDGQCPQGYPIKANEGSGIFHVPDGLFYKRTTPTRCYANEEDALADGFRKARR